MKTLMTIAVLTGMNAAWASQGAPILRCYSKVSAIRFNLDLTSLDTDLRADSVPCKTGILSSPRSLIRYQVEFCPARGMAQGFSEAQDEAGNWVKLQSFSTEAPLRNCDIFRTIEVAPDGLTGGH